MAESFPGTLDVRLVQRSAVEARAVIGQQKTAEVYFRSTTGPVSDSIEPFLIAGLVAAMKDGRPLRPADPTTPQLLRNITHAQKVLTLFDDSLETVPIQAGERPARVISGRGVGCFFSGGVDSFFTLFKHRNEITTLILVHGFDFSVDEHVYRERVSSAAQAVARSLNKQLIEIETNYRAFSDAVAPWGEVYCGLALAGVAHFLSPQLQRVYVPSSHSYADLFPWGSHPALDPLWSNEEIEIVHDGCEASRIQKVCAIAPEELALRHLRVCLVTSPDSYNCGRCEKCIRTMIGLRIAGVTSAPTLPILDLRRVSRLSDADTNTSSFLHENYRAAKKAGADRELIDALATALSGKYDRRLWRLLRRMYRRAWPAHPRLAQAIDLMRHGEAADSVRALYCMVFDRIRS
jgi:hypothetical protein